MLKIAIRLDRLFQGRLQQQNKEGIQIKSEMGMIQF